MKKRCIFCFSFFSLKNKLLIAADTGDVNDTKALSVMVKKAQKNLGELEGDNKMNVLADKGYRSGKELKACETPGVTSFVSSKESSSYALKT